jgi:hypothetical protein
MRCTVAATSKAQVLGYLPKIVSPLSDSSAYSTASGWLHSGTSMYHLTTTQATFSQQICPMLPRHFATVHPFCRGETGYPDLFDKAPSRPHVRLQIKVVQNAT